MRLLKRTIGWSLLGLIFIVSPIRAMFDKTDPVNNLLGSIIVAIYIMVGTILLMMRLFED